MEWTEDLVIWFGLSTLSVGGGRINYVLGYLIIYLSKITGLGGDILVIKRS
jgi:hypothetical protein